MSRKKKVDSMMAQQWYQICVKGHLGPQWEGWFDGLTITNLEHGEALLSGPLLDQAALHGVLAKMRDLGLPLLSVQRVATDKATGELIRLHAQEEGEQDHDRFPARDSSSSGAPEPS